MRTLSGNSEITSLAGALDGRVNPEIAFTEGADVGETVGTAQAIAIGEEAFGTIGTSTDEDMYAVSVVSGQTYHINLVGDPFFANALSDPFLGLYNSVGTLLASDDDGGAGLMSYLSYTASFTGTLYLYADAFGTQTGDYILSVYQDDVPETTGTPGYLEIGASVTGYSALSASWDDDWYAVNLTSGQSYTFAVTAQNSGTFGNTFVEVHGSTGTLLASNVGNVGFVAPTTGTYYISAGPENTSGFGTYELTATLGGGGGGGWEAPNLPEPLASIDWGFTAPSVINVFFAASGVTVADGNSDNPTFTTTGWNATEIAAAQAAFQNFANVANVTFNYVNNIASADFVMFESGNATTAYGYWGVGGGSVTYGGTNYNLDGWGVFNSADATWSTAGLAVGAYGYITLIHEIGHGMGLAHPHDNGGTSSIMQGVTSAFGDYGDFLLNQGIWTTMTYNDGWHAVNGNMPTNQGYGWQGTLMTLDIAVLQDTYGAHAYNAGANNYAMPTVNAAGTYYQAIWDSGGTDTITNPGAGASTINLNAASLANSTVGGGYVSYVTGILGGFTIANGVVIENATGGTGADTITGNSAANVLNGGGGLGIDTINGGGGNDTIFGQGGNDVLNGDAGDDTVSGGDGNDTANGGTNNDQVLGAAGLDTLHGNDGNDVVSGGNDNDTCYGDAGNDTVYGGGGVDTLWGDAGIDVMTGGDGGDTLHGGTEADQMYGIAGNDTLYGDAGNDTISGGTEADFLYGGADVDALIGAAGNDTLDGGAGNDTLTGGADIDIYFYGNGYAHDTVQGFANDVDTLNLDDALWGGGLTVLQVLQTYATQTSGGIVTFNFDATDILTVVNGAGITIAQLQNDITIV